MLIPLIKKDLTIVKGYTLGVVAIAFGLPLLLAWRQPQMGGMISLLMAVLISSVAFNLAISEKENQYPKATALLSSTPYMLAIHLFAFFHDKDGILPNIPAGKEKRCNPQRLQRFLKSVFSCAGRSHLSSFSTSLISFAVAVTIRIPLSLIVSSNVSSCRRCVFFVSGFSKRNWSTDIS